MNPNYMSKYYPRSYPWDLPTEKKVKGIAITIAPIIPPAIMKNTSLLNEKSTLASWGFILLTISTRMFLILHPKRYKNWPKVFFQLALSNGMHKNSSTLTKDCQKNMRNVLLH